MWFSPTTGGNSRGLQLERRLLASAGEDGQVLIWQVARREQLARLVHHRGAARSVRFSPDGKFLASGGDDGSVRLWDLARLYQPAELSFASAERNSGMHLNGVKLEVSGQARP